jgi:hypothetical protein
VGREKRSIPLQNVSVKVNMLDFLAEITVQQRYVLGSHPWLELKHILLKLKFT